jgi:hypothetical protein
MVSSFANNRTLADIYLDARHLLFIFPSCFLRVLSSCFLHVFGVRYAGTEGFRQRSRRRRQARRPVPQAAGCRISWVQPTGRCLMPLIQTAGGGPGRRAW